jgi:hypothetical protein
MHLNKVNKTVPQMAVRVKLADNAEAVKTDILALQQACKQCSTSNGFIVCLSDSEKVISVKERTI